MVDIDGEHEPQGVHRRPGVGRADSGDQIAVGALPDTNPGMARGRVQDQIEDAAVGAAGGVGTARRVGQRVRPARLQDGLDHICFGRRHRGR